MARFVFCGGCKGLKQVETEPYEHEPAGNYSWSGEFCACPEEEMVKEYADYAKQEIRFCPCCGAALGIKEDE